jgi:hypothetical protein
MELALYLLQVRFPVRLKPALSKTDCEMACINNPDC